MTKHDEGSCGPLAIINYNHWTGMGAITNSASRRSKGHNMVWCLEVAEDKTIDV